MINIYIKIKDKKLGKKVKKLKVLLHVYYRYIL